MLKKIPKILTVFFLTIFILQLVLLAFLLLAPNASQAAADPIKFTPQVQIGDYAFDAKDASTGNIARYVRAIYKYAIGIVGILAAVVLMVGGVMWIVAGGNATAIGEAKSWIGASLTGLLLALLSYLILATVNPALVDFKTTSIQKVQDNSSIANSNRCPAGQHLDYQWQDYAYSCKTIKQEACRCVPGSGNNVCEEKNQVKDCKPANAACGTEANKDSCDTKICCAQCCSQKCKQGNIIMGVTQLVCE